MKRKTGKILFGAYLLFLFLVVILKFNGSVQALLDRMQAEPYGKTYNLVPFATIRVQLRYLSEGWARFNLLGNTIPFIPFGFLLPMSCRKKCSLGKVLLLGLVFVLFAETVQFYANLGSFDVDDIILNMTAIFLGYIPVGIAGIVRKSKRKKKK
jgi:glycopeptide antibiotics resistance protein